MTHQHGMCTLTLVQALDFFIGWSKAQGQISAAVAHRVVFNISKELQKMLKISRSFSRDRHFFTLVRQTQL